MSVPAFHVLMVVNALMLSMDSPVYVLVDMMDITVGKVRLIDWLIANHDMDNYSNIVFEKGIQFCW